MKKELFKQGLQFGVRGSHTVYRLHRSTMGHFFITRKGNINQGTVMTVTDEGFILGYRTMDHIASAFILFSNMYLIQEAATNQN